MEQVEEICEHIVLINKGQNILEGNVNEIKQTHKDHLYRITYSGTLPTGLNQEIIVHDQEQILVFGEELRMKYLKAAFNIAGPGVYEWLVEIAWDPEESDTIRVMADDLAEAIRTGPARTPRQ